MNGSLASNPSLGNGGAGFQGSGPSSAATMIRELQGVQFDYVTGAAATNPLTLTGIAPGDTIGAVLNVTDNAVVDVADITDVSADSFTLGTVDTSAKTLLVVWYPKP